MSPATIRDVAERANVGIGTVSRVLNKHPYVSEETRLKVLSAVKELKYTPNLIAKQLSSGRTHAIAVTLPFLTYPSFVERLRGVQTALADSDYVLILYGAETIAQRDVNFSDLSQTTRIDGVLVISVPLSEENVNVLMASNTPVVLVDIFHPGFNRVFVDEVEGGKMATQHLVDLGHQKIAFISDLLNPDFPFLAMRERYHGYQQALKENNIPLNPKYHLEAPHGRYEATVLAKKLLTMEDPPTAIFAGSDTQAIGVLAAARDMNIKVPEELSVIGYDGIRDAEYMNLTTIEQPLFDSGVEGVNLLISQIENPSSITQEIRMPLKLHKRGTTSHLNNK
jgi:DNA-binding LacI/PurR family transcriptional regulator